MLSGCCGVLPEGVRRQIYIIRTSGARLLALINDVMDAAALRQNKLVLKQEHVSRGQVVAVGVGWGGVGVEDRVCGGLGVGLTGKACRWTAWACMHGGMVCYVQENI